MTAGYWIFIAVAALTIGYTMAFQRATLFWGKSLAPTNEFLPTGMQDAITPKIQTIRTLLMPVLLLVALVGGIILVKWYIGILGLVATFVLGGISRGFFPRPDSPFFHAKVIRTLRSRRKQFEADGDTFRLEAIDDVIGKMEDIAP